MTYNALRKLEKIQQQLLDSCPAWLDQDKLNSICEQKMRSYLGLMLANQQYKDVVHLLRHARFRTLIFEFVTRQMRNLTKRNNG